MLPSEITNKYFLTAGETDAQGRMPMWVIVSRVIEVATDHANILGVGYATLSELGIGWVLTRLSVEMLKYPTINESYTVTTWIEGYNRLYSDRCFEIRDGEDKVVGNIRSMWVAINMKTRSAADLTALDRSHFVLSDRKCPVSRTGKQHPLAEEAQESNYTFKFCDLDFNRHVNTVQYVRHILNQWDLEKYDHNEIARFDITFHAECKFGEMVRIRHIDTTETSSMAEIINPEGHQAVTAAISWRNT